MTPNAERHSDLIAAAQYFQRIGRPIRAGGREGLVGADEVDELGGGNRSRPGFRIERTPDQDLAADFAVRIVDRVYIRVEQAVGEVAYLRGVQRRGCAPQSAEPRVGRDVGQREEDRGIRADT